MFRNVPVLAKAVSTIHTTTSPSVIERFLLLHEGDACNELRRAESERILRAQPFIAAASVRPTSDSRGIVTLEVETTDAVALVAGVAASTHEPQFRFLRLGDANLNGEGIYVAGDWRNGTPFRDGYGARFVDNQLFGRPYLFAADGHVTPLGSNWSVDATQPFFTDIQHVAWRARAGNSDDYVQYYNDINSSHAIRLVRSFYDLGGIARVGPPGRLSLFGAALTGENERPGTTQVLVTPAGFAPDTSTRLLNQFVNHRIARANLLLGIRNIEFATVSGFDAMTATQDLPVGVQLGTMVGRSLAVLGSRDHDVFVSGDLYVGAVGHNNGLRVQVQTEGRHSGDTHDWDGLLTSSHAVEYVKLTPDNTSTISLEYSSGWRQRIPFNLTFSDPHGGLPGYAYSNIPGGQRMVARLDDRQFVGRPYGIGDFGVGGFLDAGRLWAGDIPYGVTTPIRASLGASLFTAIPAGTARIWRLDLAYALQPELRGRHFELRLSNSNKATFFLPEPEDISATRERSVPSSIFRWPE